MDTAKKERVRTLNDQLRKTGYGGRVLTTANLHGLGPRFLQKAVRAMQAFDTFDENNDPFGEHDFGALEVDSQTVFWKIDVYDESYRFAADDPSDPQRSFRVLTLMLAEDY